MNKIKYAIDHHLYKLCGTECSSDKIKVRINETIYFPRTVKNYLFNAHINSTEPQSLNLIKAVVHIIKSTRITGVQINEGPPYMMKLQWSFLLEPYSQKK